MHFWGAILYCSLYRIKNILKLLMIMGSISLTWNFQKKSFLEKRAVLPWYGAWNKYDCTFYEMFLFCFVFWYFSLLWDMCRQQSDHEVRRSILWGPLKFSFLSFTYAGVQCTQWEMLVNESMNFVVHGLFLVSYFHPH